MTELMLADTARAHDLRYVALRYFNVAGADPKGRAGQSTLRATHLIKVACETALGKRAQMEVFGTDYPTRDGTCIRDYIHVTDLARAHMAALGYLRAGGASEVVNCGYSRGYSVLEVIDAVKRASGREFAVRLTERRPGDPVAIVAASEKIRARLGWRPAHDDLRRIVRPRARLGGSFGALQGRFLIGPRASARSQKSPEVPTGKRRSRAGLRCSGHERGSHSPPNMCGLGQAPGRRALALLVAALASPASADAQFRAWIDGLWPEAEARGVSRPTFDAAFRGLEPDLKLPDLLLPGREKKADSRGQSEFTSPPSEYLDKTYLTRLAADGKALAARHKAALDKIEHEIGVDRYIILAMWGRETAYGNYKLPHDAIQVIATQAYLGRRKELFRNELLEALRMLEAGVARADMRSSWAGAVGLTQFMPSEYFEHARRSRRRWGEGHLPLGPRCARLRRPPAQGQGLGRGRDLGLRDRDPGERRLRPRRAEPGASDRRMGEARLCAREQKSVDGTAARARGLSHEPRRRLWAVLPGARELQGAAPLQHVGPLCRVHRQSGGPHRRRRRFCDAVERGPADAPTSSRRSRSASRRPGYEVEKIDGKVGSNTRHLIGTYQRDHKLKVDCWPTDAVLAHMRTTASR